MATFRNNPPKPSTAFRGAFHLVADTTPGVFGPLAASMECDSDTSYRSAIRDRYAADLAARQQLAVIARYLRGTQHRPVIEVTGPFSAEARAILARIQEQSR